MQLPARVRGGVDVMDLKEFIKGFAIGILIGSALSALFI
jgi:hypothetical protein